MYINNPHILAGFNPNKTFDEEKGTVVTAGQLAAAINQLDVKFTKLLQGTGKAGINGFTNLRGYAWLGLDGKIDPKLMPPVATTEAHIVDRLELGGFNITNPNVSIVYELLDAWTKFAGTAEYEALHNGKKLYFQKGDLIIVSLNESDDYHLTDFDFVACGTYLIVDVPNEDDVASKFQFVKISSISQSESTYSFLENKIAQLIEEIADLKRRMNELAPSNSGDEESSSTDDEPNEGDDPETDPYDEMDT